MVDNLLLIERLLSFKGGKKMVLVSTDLSPNSNKVYEWDGSNFIRAGIATNLCNSSNSGFLVGSDNSRVTVNPQSSPSKYLINDRISPLERW